MHKLFKVLLVFSVVILLPFMVLSIYNQPIGDDLWYTWMAKKYGFVEAQRQWFLTFIGRYSTNMLLSVNSFVYGSLLSFKIWPVINLIGFVGAFYSLVHFAFGNLLPVWQKFSTAVFFTSVFYLNMPGIFEGAYWLATLICYHLGVILGVLLFPWAAKFKRGGVLKSVWFGLMVFMVAGFHEIIAFIILVLAGVMLIRVWFKSKSIAHGYFILAFATVVSLVFQFSSMGNWQKADIYLARHEWGIVECLGRSMLQTGYHLLTKAILSPAFILAMGLVFFVAHKFHAPLIKKWGFASKKDQIIFGVVVGFLVFLPGFLLVYIAKHLASLRVMNLAYILFFIASVMAIGYAGILVASNTKSAEKLERFIRYKHWVIGLLLLLSLPHSRNFRSAVLVLSNGSAKRYNQQVNNRFSIIEACKTPVCPLVCLTDQPLILCPQPMDVCQDKTLIGYLEKVYNKKLIPESSK